MALFDIKTTLETVEDWFTKSGYFRKVQIGEPKEPPSEDYTAALYMDSVTVAKVYLNGGTQEIHQVVLRVYRDMLAEPQADIELQLAKLVESVSADVLGDFDLGATILAVDVAGIHGTPYSVRWGYVTIGGKMCRTVDITIPLIVDDSITVAA